MTVRRRFVLAVSPVVADDGSTALHLFSSDHWTTAPTDTPPNAPVRGLLRNPGTLRRELFSGARVTGAITPSFGNVVLANPAPNAAGAGELDEWVDYGLAGADVTLYWGPVGGAFPAAYTVVYVAKCHSFVADAAELTIRLRDDLQLLDQPVATDGFAGTGGIEGTGAVAKRKQFVAGDPGLIEPILVDAVRQIYFVQSTGTGGLHDAWKLDPGREVRPFDVYLNGVRVTRATSNYASADEMLASSPDPGYVKHWFGPDSVAQPGAKDGPVYFRLSGDAASISSDVRVWPAGYAQDADAARIGAAWGRFDAAVMALRAGVPLSRIDMGSAGLAVYAALVDDSRTHLELLADQALAFQGWFGFTRLGIFRAGYLLDPASTQLYYGGTPGIGADTTTADSVSVYTFAERQMIGPLRREPPSGMETPIWSVAATAGDTWPSQVAGGTSDTLRDYSTRKVWASFSGVAAATKLRDPGAGHADVRMRGRVIQSTLDLRLWLERYLALYGGRRHFFSFTVPLSDDVLALDLHDCVTLQHRRFGCAAGVKARIVSITIDCAANVPSMRFVLWAGTPGRYTGGSSASTPGGGGGGAPAFVPPTIAQQALGDFSGFMFGSVASSGGALAGASAADMGAFTGVMLGVLSGSGGGSSGLTWHEAEDQMPDDAVTAGPAAARAAFLAALTVSGSEGFEGAPYDPGWSMDGQSITVNGVTATFSKGVIEGIDPLFWSDGDPINYAGRFNTTSPAFPDSYRWLGFGAALTMTSITFSAPIAAFGAYATDMGDFAGQVSLVLHKSGGGTVTHDIAHTVNGNSGSLMFVGFTDDTDTYTQIDVLTTTTAEFIGLDDIVIATPAQLA